MSLNHHLLAKTTTDAILANFKSSLWRSYDDAGEGFYRVGCDSSFPSPDAAFYDDTKKLLVSFEFKPPTETKRGILTGLGQSIAYLNSSSLSYLIVPQILEDFEIGTYMSELYATQIKDRLPIGLIVYENDNPANVSLVHNVSSIREKSDHKPLAGNRFWAKHLDMPVPLFHLILHCYYLKRTRHLNIDAFEYCWNKYLVPPTVLSTLEPHVVLDLNGQAIKTLSGRKNFLILEKKINKIRLLTGADKRQAIEELKKDADSTVIGDNHYNSYRKNFVTFLKHIGMIDHLGNMTEEGFKMYHLGLVNGPTSKMFFDYFTKTVLIIGHHVDLIFDLDILFNRYKGTKTVPEIRKIMSDEYEAKGMIKRNPNRRVGAESTVEFLKYEFILWNSLQLTLKTAGIPDVTFNWKKITEICSLPDL